MRITAAGWIGNRSLLLYRQESASNANNISSMKQEIWVLLLALQNCLLTFKIIESATNENNSSWMKQEIWYCATDCLKCWRCYELTWLHWRTHHRFRIGCQSPDSIRSPYSIRSVRIKSARSLQSETHSELPFRQFVLSLAHFENPNLTSEIRSQIDLRNSNRFEMAIWDLETYERRLRTKIR